MGWEYSVAGFMTVVLIGLTGIGGGVIMAPVLFYLCITPTLVDSDSVYGIVTKWIGTWRHATAACVRWEWVRAAVVVALPAAWAGSAEVYRFRVGARMSKW